ncbi:MAG: helix-turn-helix transcriptional regulator [Clostridia bacterium]|nr:helix-turn-helix transcriptional regulator [Clostridia bacterium]
MFISSGGNLENFYWAIAKNSLSNIDENKDTQHYHNLFEIYYLCDGTCTYFIDNKTYIIEKGDLVLIPGGTIHKTQYPGNVPYSRMLINCSNYYIPPSIYNDISKLLYVYRNDDILPKIENILNDIDKDYTSCDKYCEDSLQSLVHSLFILIARNPNQKTNEAVKNEYIEKATTYIQNNFKNKIMLDDIARVCAVTPEHMSRMFKKETGFGFSEYLTLVRLQHSEYLIKNKKLSVTEIAHRCGFEDSNYFSFIFKKKYSMSPREMKAKLHANV